MSLSENRDHYRRYVGEGIDGQLKVLVYAQDGYCYDTQYDKKSVSERYVDNFLVHANIPLMAVTGVAIEGACGNYRLKLKSSFCDVLLFWR